MSSENDCDDDSRKALLRCSLIIILAVIGTVLLAILLIWLILRPAKPQFTAQIVSIAAFNLTPPSNSLTTRLLLTLSAHNPNSDIGIYYDSVQTHAEYHGQRISLYTQLPSMYQGHKETAIWSPNLIGDDIPLAPYLATELNQEEIAGAVLVSIRINGVIRWRVGAVVTAKYRLDVNCPAYVNFGGVKYPLEAYMGCHVEVGPT